MNHDPPKVYHISAYLRFNGAFYFGGRDGLITSVLLRSLNAKPLYKTFDIKYSLINNKSDIYGLRLEKMISGRVEYIPVEILNSSER